MTGWHPSRRALLGTFASAATLPRIVFAQGAAAISSSLVAEQSTAPLLGEGIGNTSVWRFAKDAPFALLRAVQGAEFRVAIENRLQEDIWFHWFGVRGRSDMMSFAVEKGAAPFECVFTPSDAGTFWFGPLLNASRQRDMGLYGMLIVDEAKRPADFLDIPLVIDDWMLGDDGTMAGGFGDLEAAIGEGRLGNWFTINGVFKPRIPLDRARPTRLRILNAANMRTFNIQFKGAELFVLALDGQPVSLRPLGVEALKLAPGQRADLLLTNAQDQVVVALDLFEDVVEAAFLLASGAEGDGLPDNFALPANPIPTPGDPQSVRRVPLVIAGGAKGGLQSALVGRETLDLRALLERGLAWALNGIAGPGGPPLFKARKNETLVIDIDNQTSFPQALHIHGHVWQLTELDGRAVENEPWRDTVLVPGLSQAALMMVADNPGQWIIQSTMAERSDAGLLGGFTVADMP